MEEQQAGAAAPFIDTFPARFEALDGSNPNTEFEASMG